MAVTPGSAREQFLASNPYYSYGPKNYITNSNGVRRNQNSQSMFVEMVERDNNSYRAVAIPFPSQDQISGELRESGKFIAGIKFLINPASKSVNMSKIVNRTQTMTAWVEDHWGEEIDTITLQGNTAAFVTGASGIGGLQQEVRRHTQFAVNKPQARADFYSRLGLLDASVPYQTSSEGSVERAELHTEPGLTTQFRRQSLSYKEMRRLIEIFYANGCIFDTSGFVRERKSIMVTYDYSSYIGYFESLDVTEDAATPFKFIYTLTFKSEKTLYSFVTRKKVNGQTAGP